MKTKLNTQQDGKVAHKYILGATAQEIANEYGVYKQVILNSLHRTDTRIRTEWKRVSGEQSGQWKSGVRIIKGYIHLLIPQHPLARKDGYVPLHRMIAEHKYNRRLLEQEVVNHIDGNILNNNPNNLEIFPTNGGHIKNHVKSFLRNKLGKFSKKL